MEINISESEAWKRPLGVRHCNKSFGQAGALRKHIRRAHQRTTNPNAPQPLRSTGHIPEATVGHVNADPHDTIYWDSSGVSFMIGNSLKFDSRYCRCFKHRSSDSFVRQLHNYGFQAIMEQVVRWPEWE